MPSIVFVPADLEPAKIVQTAIYGGTLVGIEGLLRRRQPAVLASCRRPTSSRTTGFVNVNIRPYYAEGSKTLGYEVAEQLGWRLPGQYVAPMASGSMLTKINKAFKELVGVRPRAGVRLAGLRRAVGRLLADRDGLRRGRRRGPAGEADRHREVAEHRQPGRRPLRAGRRAHDSAARWLR